MEKQNQTALQLPRQYRRADKGSIARAIGAKVDIGEIYEYTALATSRRTNALSSSGFQAACDCPNGVAPDGALSIASWVRDACGEV